MMFGAGVYGIGKGARGGSCVWVMVMFYVYSL